MNWIAKLIGHRWVVCGLLFFATTINYIDRQILSLLKPILDEQLHWTNAEFGLVNSAFQGAYGVSLLIFGWLIDKYGTKIGYAISIAAWSLAAMGHALVGSVGGFLWARVALGLGEGGNFPAAIKATAIWFPKKERALATSLFNSGANVGAILAPAIVPWMAFKFGWQSAFLAAGAVGFLWLFLWMPWFENPEKKPALSKEELAWIQSDGVEVQAQKIPWGQLLGYRQTWGFILPKLITDPVWWFFLIWLPDFFKQTRGLDIKKSWVLLVTIYSIVTVLSIAGGWVTGHLAKTGLVDEPCQKGGNAPFRSLCRSHSSGDRGLGLGSSPFDRAGRSCAPGLFSELVYDRFRLFPKTGGGFCDWNRRNGWCNGGYALSYRHGNPARLLQGVWKCRGRIRDSFCLLRGSLLIFPSHSPDPESKVRTCAHQSRVK